METMIETNQLTLMVGDITNQETDVIVNAANGTLMGGGGVDGAIHRKAGKELVKECKEIREKKLDGKELATGKAVITKGYNLPAHFVIHTVGPVWSGDKANKDELLRDCYLHALTIAAKKGLSSIAFPSISTGVYHFPIDRAANIALSTVINFLQFCDLEELSLHYFQRRIIKFMQIRYRTCRINNEYVSPKD